MDVIPLIPLLLPLVVVVNVAVVVVIVLRPLSLPHHQHPVKRFAGPHNPTDARIGIQRPPKGRSDGLTAREAA